MQYARTKRWNLFRRTPTSVCEVQPLTTQEWEERWESGAVENTHAQACMSPRFCTFRQDIFIWYVGHALDSAFYFCCHSQLNQYNLLYHQAIIAEYLGHAQHCWKVFALYWKSTRESARNAQDSGNWLDFILIHTWKMALDRGHIFFWIYCIIWYHLYKKVIDLHPILLLFALPLRQKLSTKTIVPFVQISRLCLL